MEKKGQQLVVIPIMETDIKREIQWNTLGEKRILSEKIKKKVITQLFFKETIVLKTKTFSWNQEGRIKHLLQTNNLRNANEKRESSICSCPVLLSTKCIVVGEVMMVLACKSIPFISDKILCTKPTYTKSGAVH